MRLVMENNLPPEQILPIYGPDIEHPEQCIQRLHEITRRGLRVIRGHIPYGIHDHVTWGRCLYFTMVRDPVDRVWSLWQYAKRHRTHHLFGELNKLGSLAAVLESGVSTEFNNGMCRQLSGIDGPFPQEPYAKTELAYGATSPALDAVLEHMNLNHLSVGTTENFDGFLWTLCNTMKWTNKDYRKTNAGPPRKEGDLSPNDLAAIQFYNRDDIALHGLAIQRSKRER